MKRISFLLKYNRTVFVDCDVLCYFPFNIGHKIVPLGFISERQTYIISSTLLECDKGFISLGTLLESPHRIEDITWDGEDLVIIEATPTEHTNTIFNEDKTLLLAYLD